MGQPSSKAVILATLLYKLRKGPGMGPLRLHQLNNKIKGSVLPLLPALQTESA